MTSQTTGVVNVGTFVKYYQPVEGSEAIEGYGVVSSVSPFKLATWNGYKMEQHDNLDIQYATTDFSTEGLSNEDLFGLFFIPREHKPVVGELVRLSDGATGTITEVDSKSLKVKYNTGSKTRVFNRRGEGKAAGLYVRPELTERGWVNLFKETFSRISEKDIKVGLLFYYNENYWKISSVDESRKQFRAKRSDQLHKGGSDSFNFSTLVGKKYSEVKIIRPNEKKSVSFDSFREFLKENNIDEADFLEAAGVCGRKTKAALLEYLSNSPEDIIKVSLAEDYHPLFKQSSILDTQWSKKHGDDRCVTIKKGVINSRYDFGFVKESGHIRAGCQELKEDNIKAMYEGMLLAQEQIKKGKESTVTPFWEVVTNLLKMMGNLDDDRLAELKLEGKSVGEVYDIIRNVPRDSSPEGQNFWHQMSEAVYNLRDISERKKAIKRYPVGTALKGYDCSVLEDGSFKLADSLTSPEQVPVFIEMLETYYPKLLGVDKSKNQATA